MMRLLPVAAAVGLVGILSVPILLSRRFSDADRYARELAEWHVRWVDTGSMQERTRLVADLERIRPPAASVTGASRHRRYVRAHQLAVLSADAAEGLVARVRESLMGDPQLPAFGCETLPQYRARADSIANATGVRVEWVARACDVRAAADINLAEIRSEAAVDWLKDAIEEIRPGD